VAPGKVMHVTAVEFDSLIHRWFSMISITFIISARHHVPPCDSGLL